ncbi:NADP-dependent oxidoreductase [Chelatococcus reniformis]|uniref:NADP-dependent oxidoreductase n=1 Tax=Chelatococcus reniformis TaxID=1494448 RepID=A0A916UYL8_9HYPH|nr:NADP-dependent oxidoreductase [Chelatococcus reniformis]GGC91856.1 NADP-dependent oxidoreductase [Chelatococcus reniformis]
MTTNKQWILRRRPTADITSGDLELVETPLRAITDGEVLSRNIYLSLDPTHRIWMSDRDQYLPPVELGQVMRGGVLGVVERSASPKFKPGDLVKPAVGGWEQFTIAKDHLMRPVPDLPGVPLPAHMSVLGSTGVTAYFGLMDIGQPKAGEMVVVSAAAGAVGSIAAQIAKLKGCRVVGIAGGKAKCDWLRDGLGLDGVIDYKGEDVAAALDRLCPDGIDIDFENVGGAIMDAVIARMNTFGRVSLCGMISTYNDERPVPGPADFGRVLMHRLLIKGFIVIDYFPRMAEAMAELVPWVQRGELQWKTHIVDGLENAAEAVQLLFSGGNDGKLLVRVSPEP